MVPLARRNLLDEKGRFAMSAGGVAFAVLLILIVLSLYRGWGEVGAVYSDLPSDLWVTERATPDPFHSNSLLPADNGISILDLGDYSFGRPSRVSARVSLGRGGIASIEREIELSGPIHSKGVMILSGYLAATYAQDWPLAVSATLTFEQSYDEIEGDSASSTELYALLSALSGLPLAQGIAVTGSVDQNGQVQAVGGVTHKIEGFYATCKARGLTGTQGVIVPAANVHNLMLVEAVRDGKFHVWAVRTIDEGIELLAGRSAGRRRRDGSYPADSVHSLVAARLADYAERLRAYAEPGAEANRGGRRYQANEKTRR